MQLTYTDQILNRMVSSKIYGDIFTVDDFLDIADYNTVNSTLNRLNKKGSIKRVINGYYFKPIFYKPLKKYSVPNIKKLSLVIAKKNGWNIAPDSNTSLNLLGLDNQVTLRYVYISDGKTITYTCENNVIDYIHVNTSDVYNYSFETAAVVQALKSIGKDNRFFTFFWVIK